MAISGKQWQIIRFNNIIHYDRVVIPGFCYRCKSENQLVLPIRDYLDCLVQFTSKPLDPSSKVIRSSCTHCKEKLSVIAEPYIALDMVRGHEKL